MPADGLHHITAITADAPGNVDFYARVLGLRMIKKTVNFDAPDVYHLYYGDEVGTPGTVLTFFEFPGAALGRAGAGMVHRVLWHVAGEQALEFWERRATAAGASTSRFPGSLRLADPEGLEHELVVSPSSDAALAATADDVPEPARLRGFAGVRAFHANPGASEQLLSAGLGMTSSGEHVWSSGAGRPATIAYDAPPQQPASQGAGTVHHVAWAVSDDDELLAVRAAVGRAGARPTEVIDRQYFHSVYFREPSGVLFELATAGPGFAVDEPADELGQRLTLPPRYEQLRPQLERRLTPLENPRAGS